MNPTNHAPTHFMEPAGPWQSYHGLNSVHAGRWYHLIVRLHHPLHRSCDLLLWACQTMLEQAFASDDWSRFSRPGSASLPVRRCLIDVDSSGRLMSVILQCRCQRLSDVL